MGDINLMGVEWESIGTTSNKFTGKFDGNGYAISNLNINSTEDFQGLFGYTTGTIKNVHLEGGTVRGNYGVGALAGYAGGTIENCSSTVNVYGESDFTGGLAGYALRTISNSYVTGNVVSNGSTVGGIAGYSHQKVINSYVTGNVSGHTYVGGLVGHAHNIIENSFSTGTVLGSATVGGLFGYSGAGVNVTNSISTSTVVRNAASVNSIFGSLYGRNNNGAVSNSYAVEQNFDFVGATQTGVIEQPAEYFNDAANWESVLGSAYDYSTVPPQLKSNAVPKKADNSINLQIGANFSEADSIKVDTMFDISGFSVNFATTEKASKSITQIDALLNILTTKRTELGAVSNRLDSIMSSQRTKIENYSSAKSTITDADIAKESASLISKQILQQASSSLLVQTGNLQKSIIGQLINGL